MKRVRLRLAVAETSRQAVGHEALSRSTLFEKKSSFYCPERERSIRRLEPEDIIRGKLIGKGSFNNVYEASFVDEISREGRFRGDSHESSSSFAAAPATRTCTSYENGGRGQSSMTSLYVEAEGESMASAPTLSTETMSSFNSSAAAAASTAIVPQSREQQQRQRRYVVKCTRPCYLDDSKKYKDGVIDLVTEAKILSSLTRHEHIIQMHGMAAGCISDSVSEGRFFLVLERVDCTLSDRLDEWRGAQKKGIRGLLSLSNSTKSQLSLSSLNQTNSSRSTAGCAAASACDHCTGVSSTATASAATYTEERSDGDLADMIRFQRLQIASGIVCGLRHIHSHNIAFRDMKPDNCGLDARGCVKILDFGFAKEMYPDEGSATKRPTGMVGTLRYMAPEVALCKHYDRRCDIYSLAIVLWEMFSLKKPYKKITRRQIEEKVICGGERPKVSTHWPGSLQNIMRQCWAEDPDDRPNLETVFEAIANAQRQKRRQKTSSSLRDFVSHSLHSVGSLHSHSMNKSN